ncbi:MAG: ECF transporter S component [Angelakisella sp.]
MIIISRLFSRFTVFNLVLISVMAALGVAIKPVVVPLVHLITGPLLIPGGSVAGGIYMLWIVLGVSLIRKTGTGTLIAGVQAIMVIASGVYGSHGIMSLITYLLPGLAVDAAALIFAGCLDWKLKMFFCGMAANLTGTLLSNLLFFRLPTIPLVLSVSAGALSGGLGGLVAYAIRGRLIRLGIFSEGKQKTSKE